VPSRALADVDARDCEPTEALPRGFVAAATPVVALWLEPAFKLGACEFAAAFPDDPNECPPLPEFAAL